MPTPPKDYDTLICKFAHVFGNSVWPKAYVLLVGAILVNGKRTVTAILRIMGLSEEQHFQNFHRVLNRAKWSSLALSRRLLKLLVETFASEDQAALVFGIDDTLERRYGRKIQALGIYRDPVRSSKTQKVKVAGLRWLSVMLLVKIPWAGRVWALPFLTVLCPPERYAFKRNRRHKTLTDWARQALLCIRRWLPNRKIVVVGDNGFAAKALLARLRRLPNAITLLVRMRWDAALYALPPQRPPGQRGRPRKIGERLPSLTQVLDDPNTVWKRICVPDWYGQGPRYVEIASGQAVWSSSSGPAVQGRWVVVRDPKGEFEPVPMFSSDPDANPRQLVLWFIMRWPVEVTFEEVRAHLGVETQRQWSDLAIARTTPALLGLFSLITLLAHRSALHGKLPVRRAAWYKKSRPTFSDAIALVRLRIWHQIFFTDIPAHSDMVKIPLALLNRFSEALCYST